MARTLGSVASVHPILCVIGFSLYSQLMLEMVQCVQPRLDTQERVRVCTSGAPVFLALAGATFEAQ